MKQSLVFSQIQACNFIQKRTPSQVLDEFFKYLKNGYSVESFLPAASSLYNNSAKIFQDVDCRELLLAYVKLITLVLGMLLFHFSVRHWMPLDVFYKKTALKNFTIFTGKHLYCSLLQVCDLVKKDCNTGVFL